MDPISVVKNKRVRITEMINNKSPVQEQEQEQKTQKSSKNTIELTKKIHTKIDILFA